LTGFDLAIAVHDDENSDMTFDASKPKPTGPSRDLMIGAHEIRLPKDDKGELLYRTFQELAK